jgi:hypothetical protein
MARYLRRLSLIADSFWIGCALQREYTMGQPLNYLFQNGLAKCPVENFCITLQHFKTGVDQMDTIKDIF